MSIASPLPENSKDSTKPDLPVWDLGITLGESVVAKGLGLLVILLLARVLGPEEYGKAAFLFVAMTLVSTLLDFGMDSAAVRFSARNRQKRNNIFGFYLGSKLLLLLAVGMLAWLWGDGLLRVMHKETLIQYLPLFLAGVAGESLFAFNSAYLQATRRLRLRSVLNIGRGVVTLLYLWVLMRNNAMTLNNVLYLSVLPLLFSTLFVGRYLLFLVAFIRQRLGTKLTDELMQYGQSMLSYAMVNTLLSRIDFLMLVFWVGFYALGVYSAAFQVCAFVFGLLLSLGKLFFLAPGEWQEEAVFQAARRNIRVTALVGVLAIALIPLARLFIPAQLGHEYATSIPVLQILLLALVCEMMGLPYEQALASLGKSRMLGVFRYLQLGVMIALNLCAIPIFGIYGAAATTLAIRILYLVVIRGCYRNCGYDLMRRKLDDAYLALAPVEVAG